MTGSSETSAGSPSTSARITPLDIQQKEFRVSRFGGYRMRDVDEFLDQLTEIVSELVEENARLRRQAGAAPIVGAPDLDDVARQADEIIQRARDEAARIAAGARSTSAAATTPSAGTGEARAAVKAFLQQERAFLQELAGLVQGHAETVKGMAKGARRQEPLAAEEPDAPATEETSAGSEGSAPEPEAVEAHEEQAEAASDEADSDDEGTTDRIVEIDDADATQTMPRSDERTELAQTRPGGQDRGPEGDPSLRELFWGEEG
jgi:DivIVA domain-containing protein